MKKILLAAIFGMFMSTANAITIIGNGLQSCGAYISESDKNSILNTGNISWITGYLTGLNIGLSIKNKSDFLESTDGEAVIGAVTKYCRDNPLATLQEACRDVAVQLLRRIK